MKMGDGQAAMVRMEAIVKRRGQADGGFELRVPELRVDTGEVVALIGESGCGKSTLLDLIALILAPTSAGRFSLHLAGESAGQDPAALWSRGDEGALATLRREALGYIPQTGGLLSFLSVRENIRLPCRIKGVGLTDRELETLAKRLGVAECLDRKPHALSIGQRQRVAILRAIAHGPRLLLADEPTAALDKPRARAVLADMNALACQQHLAVVVVTHDLDLLAEHVDRAYTFDLERLSESETRSTCRALDDAKRVIA